MSNLYTEDPVQFLALDAWNGSVSQVAGFAATTGITYPVLMNAGSTSVQYAGGYDYVYIVDQAGVVAYRNLSGWNGADVVDTIESLLTATAVETPTAGGFRFEAPWPNPFNPRTTIAYEIAGESGLADVRLEVLDLRGRLVTVLTDGTQARGQRYQTTWNGRGAAGAAASGVYHLRLTVDGVSRNHRVTLIK